MKFLKGIFARLLWWKKKKKKPADISIYPMF